MRDSCGQSWGAQQEPGKGRRGCRPASVGASATVMGGRPSTPRPRARGRRGRRGGPRSVQQPPTGSAGGIGAREGVAPHLPVAGLGRGGEGQGTARPAGPPRLSLRPTPAGQSAFDPEQPESWVLGPPSPPTAAASGTPSLRRRRARDVIASAPPLALAPPPHA